MDPSQKFYRHFQDSVAVLQDQILALKSTSNIGGERQAAHDHILAGLSKLQNEVADAAEYTPSYDRRQYSQSVKSLHEKLSSTMSQITPKTRFQFRRTSNTEHVDMGAPENDPRFNPGSLSRNKSVAANPQSEDDDTVSELPFLGKNYNEEMAQPSTTSWRRPSFSTAKQIGISNQRDLHIMLPISASRATAAGSLTDLERCIVDMSVPTSKGSGTPFPGLSVKNINGSLLVVGRVSGAVHITGVKNSIIVVIARQVRIHECKNVDLYLHCGSHPIIEDCSGMRFAPLPDCFKTESEETVDNQWDQVDDFKWLKTEHSPNWSILVENERLEGEAWTKVVKGQPGLSVGETLKKVGLPG